MTVFLDLAGAWAVRVSMIAVMLSLTVTMNDALFVSTQQATAKGNITAAAEVISQDLNCAGFNVTPGNAFSYIASSDLWFSGDLNGLGSPETIHYYTEYDSQTQLYRLYRYVDRENSGRPLLIGSNFTSVTFLYYDYKGVPTSTAANVYSVRVKLAAQVPGVTQGFTSALNDFRIYPANL
jgi:hypothetical protein